MKKKASIFLSREMADFVINEFASNSIEYYAKYDCENVGEDVLTEIQYDPSEPFAGNCIFIAGVAFTNEFYNKIGRKITAENIINSALNKKEDESNN